MRSNLSSSATLPASLGDGPARARARDLTIDIDELAEGNGPRAQIPGASVDIVASRPPGHESLAVVVPWGDRRFQYTVKDVARPAAGTITVGGVVHDVVADEFWGAFINTGQTCAALKRLYVHDSIYEV